MKIIAAAVLMCLMSGCAVMKDYGSVIISGAKFVIEQLKSGSEKVKTEKQTPHSIP